MSRAEMSLADVQCHLDKEGASNLVIDLIMNASSDRVFHESILLAIALLEGGNTTIQVGRCCHIPAKQEQDLCRETGTQLVPRLLYEKWLILTA
ncbi:Inositol 1,4,5-trisphosphate receptor type 1 [Pteropus alecto]|uniref:Inositol 1,4,5-trisphosphate receptor type 1 n=1 Tax=Pteropus alecto TaxID=9402 RepID=L5JT53_PTEAL|nr:Inositol 1,4,5-trisphosphate receptor type 1 [Pteropus alecto]